jgi:uncharacterized protein YjbI with pentapeptide repeats
MTRNETIALFLQGKVAWNAWAKEMLAERKALEANGSWAAEEIFPGILEPKNNETRDWIDAARADFSRCHFLARRAERTKEAAGQEEKASGPPAESIQIDGPTDFNGFVFPGDANFGNAAFSGDASFHYAAFSGDAYFDGVTFSGPAWFLSAAFSGSANFQGAACSGNANFVSAAFSSGAYFQGATFSGDADFSGAAFKGDAYFRDTDFSGNTDFRNAAFGGGAGFRSVTFSGVADFRDSVFQNSTGFQGAEFQSEAHFTGMKVERAFGMTGANFAQVPAFNQADFKQAPDLDNVRFPLPGFWLGGNEELTAKYRAIRRMAILGADYEPEQMAFKGELRSKRWRTDRPWHPGLWFGLVYDGIADCGRSAVRPVIAWLLCIAVFAVPRSVAIASGIQKLLSAIFIFLFGLAVRNMLKMK